jgi:hypothetical protein
MCIAVKLENFHLAPSEYSREGQDTHDTSLFAAPDSLYSVQAVSDGKRICLSGYDQSSNMSR